MARAKEDSLEIIVAEQRRDYDYLLQIYDRMRATEGLLLTATYAVLGYLYYRVPEGNKLSIIQRLSIPSEDYGKIIYLIAGLFFLYGIVKLTLNVFGYNPWETAYETTKSDYKYTKEETLLYYKKRYDDCNRFNAPQYMRRRDELNFLFYCILISAIILIVIKTLN